MYKNIIWEGRIMLYANTKTSFSAAENTKSLGVWDSIGSYTENEKFGFHQSKI